MNTIKTLLLLIATVASVGAAEFTAEPYAALSWQGLNGHSKWGVGISPTLALTKNLSLVGYFESDNKTQELVDRVAGGVRYTAYLGKVLSLDAGVALGYATELDNSFIRLPLGANINLARSGNLDLYIRGQYIFDVDGDGKEGRATGRVFLGPVLSFKF